MPRACVRSQSPSQGGWSEDFWPLGLSLSQYGHVFANSVRYILKERFHSKWFKPRSADKPTKGRLTVVMDKTDYFDKMDALVNDKQTYFNVNLTAKYLRLKRLTLLTLNPTID